ncbi:hypothetical protein [Streptomyces caeruleatus]|nr:hypothetical protein [Streptomyces caeruleatus]
MRLGIRDASGADRWAEERVEHVYRFDGDELVARMDVRPGSSGGPAASG